MSDMKKQAKAIMDSILDLSSYQSGIEIIEKALNETTNAAIEQERKECKEIAIAVEKQSAELMKAAPAPETDMKGKEYYRGRERGAALIAQRIFSRSLQ